MYVWVLYVFLTVGNGEAKWEYLSEFPATERGYNSCIASGNDALEFKTGISTRHNFKCVMEKR